MRRNVRGSFSVQDTEEVGHGDIQKGQNGGEVDVDGRSNAELCGATSNGEPANSKRTKQSLKKKRQRQRGKDAAKAAADAAARRTRKTALQRDRRRAEVTLKRGRTGRRRYGCATRLNVGDGAGGGLDRRGEIPTREAGETENTRGLDDFVEQRRQNLLEVRNAMERRNELRMMAREKANDTISRPSAGVSERGSLVLVRTSASLRHRDRRGMKRQNDGYTGPWTVVEVLEKGLSVHVEMKGLRQRSRRLSVADVKPFHVRPVHLRHIIADEFGQNVWGPDLKLPESSDLMPEY